MVHGLFLFTYFFVQIALIFSQGIYYPDSNNMIIGNLRRREVIPLNPFYNRRKYGGDGQGNLNYRRTKDIREEFIDRRFELSESQLRDAELAAMKEDHLNQLHNELRWLTLDTGEGIGIGIRIDQQPNMMYIGQR